LEPTAAQPILIRPQETISQNDLEKPAAIMHEDGKEGEE